MWRNSPLPCVPRWFSYNLPTINYFSHIKIYRSLFVCMFRIFHIPLENFSLIWRCHHYWRGATNFDQCSALMTIEQRRFFNVSHLLLLGPTLYNVHLWEHVTLTLVAEHLAVNLSLVVLKTWICPNWGSNPNLLHARWTLYHYVLFTYMLPFCNVHVYYKKFYVSKDLLIKFIKYMKFHTNKIGQMALVGCVM